MIDDDKKGKWLVPLVSQSGRSCLVQAPADAHSNANQLTEVKFNTEVVLYSVWGKIKSIEMI